ncbi:SDR family oxidoreductase [Microbacterium hatanonis]|uniref:SDR family NAD(P)-dependent oxidoreductase n=1 Tax=Microbacterium hatanonis TaxID=404366 RepID=A0A5C8HWZ2_9MICO|nr:SDR family NAD(P)-dependent oxidoreductase [Microbacterium hatanonis]TXK09762.1 SDR family NAD(P)-dependent oxidoreductase [Microbacterium hatanonis]
MTVTPVSWVIGGGTGIGEASARALARLGGHVVVSGRRVQELDRVVAEIRSEGGAATPLSLDVADDGAVSRAVATIEAEHGPVATLVFSAGTNVQERFWNEVTPSAIGHVMDVNLHGAVRAVHAVLPGMRAARGGRIVLVSSWAAWRHSPGAGAAYSMSKTALGVLAESVNAQEHANGVRATHLCPGEVATDILDTRPNPPSAEARESMLRAEDVGEAVGWIAALPERVCVNELVLTPTSNTSYA